MQKKTLRIRECAGMECGGVEEARPVVTRVKLLGEESRNNRRYLPESIAPSEYERKPVNLNHPDGGNKQQRRVEDRFGWIENPIKEGAAWWGDLHYNPAHPFAKQFEWLAKNQPSLIGLSHDARGTGHYENGTFIVEKAEVKSVDLVADPASTKGLYESMEPENPTTDAGGSEEKSLEQQIGELIVAIIKDDCPVKEKRSKVMKALKLIDEPEEEEGGGEGEEESEGDEGDEDESGEKETEESLKATIEKNPGLKRLAEELATVKAALALRERHELATRLCEEAKLPAVAVSKQFYETLVGAKDEAAMKSLIEAVKAAANIKTPRSASPGAQGGGDDAYLKAIKAAKG